MKKKRLLPKKPNLRPSNHRSTCGATGDVLLSLRMSLSVGQQLREARQAKKLSLEQAARATRIRLRYLEALEADELDVFPSPVQARGFLKLYANWLGLSLEALLARQREDIAAEPLVSQPPEPTPSSNVEEDEEETSRPISPRRKRVSKRTEPVSTIAPAIPKTEEIPEEQAAQEAAPSPESTTLSQQLFSSIGALLRKQRETLGISLEEAESHVHIRKPVLQILESGAFERLASPVQARGLIQTYARFLDLDVETLLVRFAEALQAQRLERLQHVESKPARSQTRWQLPLKLRRYLSMDVLIS
ncbi:MAG: helix-turn-helix domain-containing protein, partial [Anaerolineales bacterium]|nr:helix-turn-helix domain-containing protein [Anaerolineales bacterium]